MQIKLVIPGEPVAKGRPRFYRGHAVTPQKTREYEAYLQATFRDAFPDMEPIRGAVVLTVKSYRSIPKSASKKMRQAMLSGEIQPTTKPDWDNYGKVSDALNELTWIDDGQVVKGTSEKWYSDEPRMEIIIETKEAAG